MEYDKECIVFFDSECLLCSRAVQFLARHNSKCDLYFASLSSELAKKLGLLSPDSVLFWERGKIFDLSDAVLRACAYLDFPWSYCAHFRFFPAFLRDFLYRFVAKNRKRWFPEVCDITLTGMDRILL